MGTIRKLALLPLALSLVACEAIDGSRSGAPAPDPATVGWVEFALVDHAVPPDPIGNGSGAAVEPPTCELTIELDGQPVASEVLRPAGASPPYSVASTQRFSALPGDHLAMVHYDGCRTFGRRLDSVEAGIPISVRRGHVTRMRFDGAVLEADSPSQAVPGPESM